MLNGGIGTVAELADARVGGVLRASADPLKGIWSRNAKNSPAIG